MGRIYIGGSYSGKSHGSFRESGDVTPFVIAIALVAVAITPLFWGIKWPLLILIIGTFAAAIGLIIYVMVSIIIVAIKERKG